MTFAIKLKSKQRLFNYCKGEALYHGYLVDIYSLHFPLELFSRKFKYSQAILDNCSCTAFIVFFVALLHFASNYQAKFHEFTQ